MNDKALLLNSIRLRKSHTGIVTADRYFREVEGCFEGGHCPLAANGSSQTQWQKQLSDAESKLTYTNSEMVVLKKTIRKSSSSGLLQFDAIITTPRRDRDGDVLETKGAKLDKHAPLLWQHIHMQPIGKLVRTVKTTDSELIARLAIADTALGRDAVELVKMGALRISHGFEPIEYEPMEDEQGWRFKQFNIYEISLVSIPSNVDAVVTDFAEKSFNSELMQGWQKAHTPKIVIPEHACTCQQKTLEFDIEHADAEPIVVEAQPVQEHAELIPQKAMQEPEGDEPDDDDDELICKDCGSRNVEKSVHCKDCDATKPMDGKSPETPIITKSLDEIEREYLAALAMSDTATLRRSHGRLTAVLNAAEDQQEASEWDTLMSQLI